jgi:FkbM family methyltransferase
MKALIKSALTRAGLYYAKRRYMPCGIDWLWDIQRILRDRSLGMVVDVGANVGQTSRAIKERFPASTVHAFEPVRETYELLVHNCRGFEGVTAHRIGLSDTAGSAWMAVGSNSQINHLVGPTRVTASATVEQVETNTLDAFCAERSIERIDLLKVDAEGADLQVLQGAERMFRDKRVAFVFVEVGFDPADQGHVHVTRMLENLSSAGFQLYAFYDYYHDHNTVDLVFANVLFIGPAALAAMR